MRVTVLQEGKHIVENFIKVAPGEFGVTRAAGKRVVEIDVKMEPLAALGGRHDAEARAKLRRIKVELRVAALRPSDRLVGVTLIEHFNRRTGRCDPSLERLSKLLGLSIRTVIRATQRLQRAGLFRKTRHGGYSNRNSYEPDWRRLEGLDAAWGQKLREHSAHRRTSMSPDPGQHCHAATDIRVTQSREPQRYLAAVERQDAHDTAKQRGFPCTVVAEQGDYLSWSDMHVDAVENRAGTQARRRVLNDQY